MIAAQIFKANDIRGLIGVPDAEWDLEGARAIGAAYVHVFDLAGKTFVMGRDMRVTGPQVSAAFADGAMAQGADVIDVGLASTDALWYASGVLGLHGVQFTASHNPASYNGVKFCLPGAAPVTPEHLLRLAGLAVGDPFPDATVRGTRTEQDILAGYGDYLRSLVDLDGLRPLTVVVDAGNGMAGHTTPAVLGPLGLDLVGLYLDLDGTFPHHMPNPLIPENLVDAQAAVREHGADLALVFDGDADRCFIIDEHGDVVSPSIVTALIASQELAREPGGTIVINTITSRAVGEVVDRLGGKLVISNVGHTSVKALMAEHDAVFGGEHSAHYYFRDFWGADTGMLAGLHVLSILGSSDAPMSALAGQFAGYVGSGEINSVVADVPPVLDAVVAAFAGRGTVDTGDGVTVSGDDWWVNVRPSNTEPLLRLNVEARDEATMAALRDEALAIIRKEK
ncbi:phosphomannomutase/phosphoglucomutase [Propioniciclava sp.]|uniref:phosphomannomutase/phosphoglucomutase n=1 Tax=Propioniciclava sp. TaxID=2038686 RepID=UPI0026281F3A|nr:phosphomannomutase/phosphoglucomutase [Propioniciclava sp.]